MSTSGGEVLSDAAAASRQITFDAATAAVVVPPLEALVAAAAKAALASDVAVAGLNVIRSSSNIQMITVTVQLRQGTTILPGRYCETFLDPLILIQDVLKKFSTSFSMKHRLCFLEDINHGQLNMQAILANIPTEYPEEKNGHRKLNLLYIRVPLLVSLSVHLTTATNSEIVAVKQKFVSTKTFFSAISAALNVDIRVLKAHTVSEASSLNENCITEYSWSNPALQGSIGDMVELIYGAHDVLKEYELNFSITAVAPDA